MSAFYFTFLAVLLAGVGARDQWTVAVLALRQGRRPGVLIASLLISLATAAFAAWAATAIAPLLAPRARVFLVAIALAMAGLELLVVVPDRKPEEPTHSLGALALVILAHQLTDAARFLIFAIAIGTNAPLAAGLGGAAAGMATLAAGWLAPEWLTHPRLRTVRRLLGALLMALSLILGLRAFDRL